MLMEEGWSRAPLFLSVKKLSPKQGAEEGRGRCLLQSLQWSSWENIGVFSKAEWRPGQSTDHTDERNGGLVF